MNEAQLIAFIDSVDKDIPLIKQFLATAANSPLLVTLVTKLFPSWAAILPVLQQVAPYLDFLQAWADKADAALKS